MSKRITTLHQPLTPPAVRKRWLVLGISSFLLLAAWVNAHGAAGTLTLACPLRQVTGIPCPTCGMTRSFIAIAQGDLSQACSYHLFGPVLFSVLVVTVGHVLIELVKQHSISPFYMRLIQTRHWQFLGISLYLGYYLVRVMYWGYHGQLESALS